MTSEHFDVLIIGAGFMGIGAAYRIQTHCPDRTYLILKARERLGGTGTCFGIRVFALILTCTPWPIRFNAGRARRRSSTAPRS